MAGILLTLLSTCCIATSQRERLMVRTTACNVPIPTVLKSPEANAGQICFVLLTARKLPSGNQPCLNQQCSRDATKHHMPPATARASGALCKLWSAQQDLGEKGCISLGGQKGSSLSWAEPRASQAVHCLENSSSKLAKCPPWSCSCLKAFYYDI